MRRLSRFALALWIAVLALTAGAVEQQQLASTVIAVTLAEAGGHAVGHYMPDGTYMAGSMASAAESHAGHEAGGHTHKGHADCEVCGTLAAMAGFTLPVIGGIIFPPRFTLPPNVTAVAALAIARPPAPYASRAPPANA
jgi:hypothetical protein